MASGKQQLARLAAEQHGVVTRAQALASRITKRRLQYRLDLGLWKELCPKVYRLPGTADTWLQRLTAAKLWAQRDYAFSHRCAAALWGLDRFKKEVVELTTARRLRSVEKAIVHNVGSLAATDIAFVNGFRVTTMTRTLADLAENEAFNDVRASVDQALRRKWTTLDALEMASRRDRPGMTALRSLVLHYLNGGKPAESELEARVYELFEASGLPWPVKQEEIKVGDRVCRVDFHVPGTRLIVEADGQAFHGGDAFDTDRIRDIVLESNGYIVQRWTWKAVDEQPALLVEAARRVIALGPRPEDSTVSPP